MVRKKSKNKELAGKAATKEDVRHLGVLIEDVNDGVKLLAEQLDTRTDSIRKTLDAHTEMIGKLAVDMTIVKEDIEFIKNSMKRKIDIDEFAALERRVALLERRR